MYLRRGPPNQRTDLNKEKEKKRVIFKTNASRRDWGSVECDVNEDLNDPGKEVSVRVRDTWSIGKDLGLVTGNDEEVVEYRVEKYKSKKEEENQNLVRRRKEREKSNKEL